MSLVQRWHAAIALVLLLLALLLGVLAALAYLYPAIAEAMPFQQMRPAHVSAALFWIITGATAGVMRYREDVFLHARSTFLHGAFLLLWTGTIITVFIAYSTKHFGGREYWEFPPLLSIPLLLAWLLLMADYFRGWLRRNPDPPLYVWMWTTGIVFFLITFIEQNLWQIPWFRDTYMREISVQWKSNGAMVGAWNQMIYGSALFIMARISGDDSIARGPKVYLFWFLGLSNLMFNWGHHIYNAPSASWIRHLAYGISMAEWIFLINIMRGFRSKLAENRRLGHLTTYRFLIASELWVFLNLFLALLMSIPAINRYTHGTHITVAHAMGATIGINTMILIGSMAYMLRVDERGFGKHWLERGRLIAMLSLFIFWIALIVAGVLKGWRATGLGMADFQEVMRPVNPVLAVFAFAGFGVLAGLGIVAFKLLTACFTGEGLDRASSVSHRPSGRREETSS